MTQRDLIKDQVEQLGRVLGKITAMLLDLDTSGNIDESVSQVTNQLKEKLDLDMKDFMALPEHRITEVFENKFNNSEVQIEKFADLLFKISELNNSVNYLEKAIFSLQYARQISTVFSMDRDSKAALWAERLNRLKSNTD